MGSAKRDIIYRSIKTGEEAKIVNHVLKVFDEFVAPHYSSEGVTEFRKFVCTEALADRLKDGDIVVTAVYGQKIIGVIEIRENSHVALLFVERSFQHSGIARELLKRAIKIGKKRKPDLQKITVNSSPNAFAAYQKIGFKIVADEKSVNGIRFIPMAFVIHNRGD